MAPRLTLALLLAGAALARASPFADLRAVDVMEVVRGIWRRSRIPRVPPQPTEEEFAALPPAGLAAASRGHLGLDFTWNDSVAHVWIDTMTPGSVVAAPAALHDARLGVAHAAGALPPAHGPLLGVNTTLEVCSAAGAWEALAPAPGAPLPHADNLTLYGIYGGLLHVPLAPVWGMLGVCQTRDCTHPLRRGPPLALAQALAPGGAETPAGLLRRALGASAGGAAAAAAAAPALAAVGMHLDGEALVVVGEAGAGASAASAAAAAAAHAAALSPQPDHRELLFGAAAYLFPPATAPGGAPPARCSPGSVRLSSVEWRFAPAPLHLLARLALSEDAWLWAYNRDASEALGGWDRYLRDLTHSGAALLFREGCMVQHNDPSPAVCEGRVEGPAAVRRVRSEASWVLLDGFTHKRSVSAGEAAAGALGAGSGFSGLPPVLPAAANLSFFKLLHWWPGYDLDARLRDVRGVGGPPLVSFVVTPQPRTTWLLRTFGDAWVIACYMGFAGAVISVHALSVCWGEAQHRKRMMAGKARRGGERRDRLGSANSRSSDGAPESAGPSPEGKKSE